MSSTTGKVVKTVFVVEETNGSAADTPGDLQRGIESEAFVAILFYRLICSVLQIITPHKRICKTVRIG